MNKHNSIDHINQVLNKEISTPISTPALNEAEQLLSVKRNQIFIEDDTFIGNPHLLLGNIIEIRKRDEKCPTKFTSSDAIPEFSIIPLQGFKVDSASILKQPIKRQSLLIDHKLSFQISFLNYLSSELDHESIFNVMVFDQAASRINTTDTSWTTAVSNWRQNNQHLIEDDNLCYLLAIVGMVQKNVIRKKYTKFKSGIKGGGWGINFKGTLHTSNEDYSLDFRFGLSVGVIKRPSITTRGETINKKTSLEAPTDKELKFFSDINKVSKKI